METTPDELWSPDAVDPYNLVPDLAAMLDTIQAALLARTPTGVLAPFGGDAAPAGWLLCNGAAISRATYPGLWAVFGTKYGAGDGSTTFNLPDLRGRAIVGMDAAQTEFNTLGKTGGAKTHTLTKNEMPSHTHGLAPGVNVNGSDGGVSIPGAAGSDYGFYWRAKIPEGGGQAHNNLQPYISLNYIVKA